MLGKILKEEHLPSDEIIKAIGDKYQEYLNNPLDNTELMELIKKIRETEQKFSKDSGRVVRMKDKPKGIFNVNK